ncbi:MAG: hypothetical protein H6628_01770 [Calditrichae bacterium]|nr:hypothetical protein [Calditrichia bacterium]
MVRTENYTDNTSRILEAETFLVIRAAQRAYQQVRRNFDSNAYKNALKAEFEKNHIYYQAGMPAATLPTDARLVKKTARISCVSSAWRCVSKPKEQPAKQISKITGNICVR